MELARLAALLIAALKRTLTPNQTPRDRGALFYGGALRTVDVPGWFPAAKIYAQDMLLFVLCATYACISPLILG